MSRALSTVAALLAPLLVVATAAISAEPAAMLDSFWRTFFARPAATPDPGRERGAGQRIALGKALFSDVRMSGPGTRACATCHQPARAFADGRARAQGLDGGALARNTPALWNLAWGGRYAWDGRAGSLEAQSRAPLEHANEMGGDWPGILARLRADRVMVSAFASAFPDEDPAITPATVIAALVAFERSLVSPPTRFDRWVAGEATALSREELAGFRLFVGRAGCVGCHGGWRFTDDRFHDIGLAGADEGRGGVAGGIPGLRAFKTPGLREAVHTAPYMHDGSLATLEAVLAHYAGGFRDGPGTASGLVRGLELAAEEREQLVAFLHTLSSSEPPPRDGVANR